MGTIVVVDDFSARKNARSAPQAIQDCYSSLFQDCPVPLLEVDLAETKRRVEVLRSEGVQDFGSYFESYPEEVAKCAAEVDVLDVNQAALEFYQAAGKKDFRGFLSRLCDEASWIVLWEALVSLAEGKKRLDGEISMYTTKREKRTAAFRLSVAFGQEHTLSKVVISLVDMTERRWAEEELRRAGFRDVVTGLYNRAYFLEELHRLENSRDYPIALISIGIGGLRLINDAVGQEMGDKLLRGCADMLRSSFRMSDILARIGDDEFAVILPRMGKEGIETLRERLESNVDAHNENHADAPLSIAFGAEVSCGADLTLLEAFKRADKNMYREKANRGADASHGVVGALLEALAAKDFVSAGHTHRVRELSTRVGETVGLSKAEMAELALLAEVHDLGKVGIPDQVLFKEGALAADEELEMREHTAIGYRIARASDQLSHIAELILFHHEWWNGEGYPSGLRADEIPMACRIISIVDAYDAMTNDRPYRKALTREQAARELQRCAGTQFDPWLVKHFLGIVAGQ